MFRKLFLTLFLFMISTVMVAQDLDEIIKKIDLKLRRDKRYLNLHYVEYPSDGKIDPDFTNLPRINEREPVSLQAKDNIVYRIVFLKDAIGVDSMIVLYVDQITNLAGGDSSFFGDASGPSFDTTRVLTFGDMFNLKNNYFNVYYKFFKVVDKFIKENPDSDPPTLLRINPDQEIQTSLGLSSRDNTDFLNYMRANHPHWYPKPKVAQKTSRRGPEVVEVVSPYKIDATPSLITFSHEVMDFSLGGASVELGFEDKVFNVLPFRGQSVTGGFRTLISLSEKKEEIEKAVMVDARLLARAAVDLTGITDFLVWNQAASPRLNISNGAGLDLSLTRPFGLPFWNFYVMAGVIDYQGPALRFSKSATRDVAYFGGNTMEWSMSFYWNESDNYTTRFRMDVGVGYHDVQEAEYAKKSNSKISSKEIYANIAPMVQFHLNFAPEGTELFASKTKIYDGVIKFAAWLKLFELDGGHQFRLETQLVTAPVTRKKRPYETAGGASMQLRYRFGL